jgi:hypothetical protein
MRSKDFYKLHSSTGHLTTTIPFFDYTMSEKNNLSILLLLPGDLRFRMPRRGPEVKNRSQAAVADEYLKNLSRHRAVKQTFIYRSGTFIQ